MGATFSQPADSVKRGGNMGSRRFKHLHNEGADSGRFDSGSKRRSMRRFRSWTSRLSLKDSGGENFAYGGRCNLENHKRQNTESKWPPNISERLFLPDFPLKICRDDAVASACSEEIVNDYEVLNELASGNFGKVVRARCIENKRECALKVIDKNQVLSEGSGVIQQCKDEVTIQRAVCSHILVATLLENWQTQRKLYLALEFVPGGELFHVWKTVAPLPESSARFYVGELICVLDFLHRAGVVYRDLKLENVLLDAEGHIKLVDFGLAKWLRRGDRTRTICGTLIYTAPEMLFGRAYDHAVDWWSLGVLSFALLVGRFPTPTGIARTCAAMRELMNVTDYNPPAPGSVSTAHGRSGQRAAPNLSVGAKQLLHALLHKEPQFRLCSTFQLQQISWFKDFVSLSLFEKRAYPAPLLPQKNESSSELLLVPNPALMPPKTELIVDKELQHVVTVEKEKMEENNWEHFSFSTFSSSSYSSSSSSSSSLSSTSSSYDSESNVSSQHSSFTSKTEPLPPPPTMSSSDLTEPSPVLIFATPLLVQDH